MYANSWTDHRSLAALTHFPCFPRVILMRSHSEQSGGALYFPADFTRATKKGCKEERKKENKCMISRRKGCAGIIMGDMGRGARCMRLLPHSLPLSAVSRVYKCVGASLRMMVWMRSECLNINSLPVRYTQALESRMDDSMSGVCAAAEKRRGRSG